METPGTLEFEIEGVGEVEGVRDGVRELEGVLEGVGLLVGVTEGVTEGEGEGARSHAEPLQPPVQEHFAAPSTKLQFPWPLHGGPPALGVGQGAQEGPT